MINLEGVHGTSEKLAREIEKEGFLSRPGRSGTGAYFWRQGKYSRSLAIGWFVFRKEGGRYSEPDPHCVIIYAGIECEDQEILDLLDFEVREELARMISSQGLGDKITDRQTAALYDLLVNKLEMKLKKKFKVLNSMAAPPPKTPYPMKVLGAPLMLLVRDPKSIKIKKLEKVNDN